MLAASPAASIDSASNARPVTRVALRGPDLEAGNVLAKSVSFAGVDAAGIVIGAHVPQSSHRKWWGADDPPRDTRSISGICGMGRTEA